MEMSPDDQHQTAIPQKCSLGKALADPPFPEPHYTKRDAAKHTKSKCKTLVHGHRREDASSRLFWEAGVCILCSLI